MRVRGRTGEARGLRSERGASIVELALVLAGLGLLAGTMIGFFVGVTQSDRVHREDDAALEDARNARALMSRDVREARRFTEIGPAGFTVWVDELWDDVTDPSELISWTIDASGALVRTEGGFPLVTAGSVLGDQSTFTFDSAITSEVRSVDLHLVVATGTATHVIDTTISLRNVP
jgi:Tfp pilus assembly protein PilW